MDISSRSLFLRISGIVRTPQCFSFKALKVFFGRFVATLRYESNHENLSQSLWKNLVHIKVGFCHGENVAVQEMTMLTLKTSIQPPL